MTKYFIITIDTEGDNLWREGCDYPITTQNAFYLTRFQRLCEKYGFIPTWLTNYEMIKDRNFVEAFKPRAISGKCEIGMHLHAWNNPPVDDSVQIKGSSHIGHPFLIQYPESAMRQKIEYITNLIHKEIGISPTSHRAGRWMINDAYLQILDELGYIVDTTVTPGINWAKIMKNDIACDYTNEKRKTSMRYKGTNLLEVPVSIRTCHLLNFDFSKGVKWNLKVIKRFITGKDCWLRPTGNNLNEMKAVVNSALNGIEDYAMFMIHSSELMPEGSPTFKDSDSIEKLYNDLDKLFDYLKQKGFVGISLSNYAKLKR